MSAKPRSSKKHAKARGGAYPDAYVNAPAHSNEEYDRVMDPEVIAEEALAQPGVAELAQAYGPDWKKQVLDFARDAVVRLRPFADRGLEAFDRLRKFLMGHLESASVVSDKALRAVFDVALWVVVLAIRITSPLTTRVVGYAIKAAVPEILAAAGIEAAALPFGLSDPATKTDVARLDAAALEHIRAELRTMPFYRFRYRRGAADPDDGLEHLGMMADELRRRFHVGDGHAVPVLDLLTVLAIAQRGTDRDLAALQRKVDALTRQVVLQARARPAAETTVVSGWIRCERYGSAADLAGIFCDAFPHVSAAGCDECAAQIAPRAACREVCAFGRRAGPVCLFVRLAAGGVAALVGSAAGPVAVLSLGLSDVSAAVPGRVVARLDGARCEHVNAACAAALRVATYRGDGRARDHGTLLLGNCICEERI